MSTGTRNILGLAAIIASCVLIPVYWFTHWIPCAYVGLACGIEGMVLSMGCWWHRRKKESTNDRH